MLLKLQICFLPLAINNVTFNISSKLSVSFSSGSAGRWGQLHFAPGFCLSLCTVLFWDSGLGTADTCVRRPECTALSGGGSVALLPPAMIMHVRDGDRHSTRWHIRAQTCTFHRDRWQHLVTHTSVDTPQTWKVWTPQCSLLWTPGAVLCVWLTSRWLLNFSHLRLEHLGFLLWFLWSLLSYED